MHTLKNSGNYIDIRISNPVNPSKALNFDFTRRLLLTFAAVILRYPIYIFHHCFRLFRIYRYPQFLHDYGFILKFFFITDANSTKFSGDFNRGAAAKEGIEDGITDIGKHPDQPFDQLVRIHAGMPLGISARLDFPHSVHIDHPLLSGELRFQYDVFRWDLSLAFFSKDINRLPIVENPVGCVNSGLFVCAVAIFPPGRPLGPDDFIREEYPVLS